MDHIKSLDDPMRIIAALLRDVQKTHGVVFNNRAYANTLNKVEARVRSEGLSFLTKTLPSLGKALEKALSGKILMTSANHHFDVMERSELPKFLGEFFIRIFHPDGTVLREPCANSVKAVRQVLFLYYKYELTYSSDQEDEVISAFLHAENDIRACTRFLDYVKTRLLDPEYLNRRARLQRWHVDRPWFRKRERLQLLLPSQILNRGSHRGHSVNMEDLESLPDTNATPTEKHDGSDVLYSADIDQLSKILLPPCQLSWRDDIRACVSNARRLLFEVFKHFDPTEIIPSHGPGSVSTKERLQNKWIWSNIPDRITECYPIDTYFYVSPGHVCDHLDDVKRLTSKEDFAKVILVPKDSRGPRLISCEPLAFQWVQQGLSRAIVTHVERNPLSRKSVHFTDQEPNRRMALQGSIDGRYATLDLKEASDRISLALVNLLFPEPLLRYLKACRSLGTVLPNGEVLMLEKFAPMGSALCFPVMALTIWALLAAIAPDADTRDSILVYGDDVIVKEAFASDAIELLESFGLVINRDKSCTVGLFRESCGMDAFMGIDVTPVRFRTVWSSTPSPNVFASWISYANSFYDRGMFHVYNEIVDQISAVYGAVPSEDMALPCPSLRSITELTGSIKSRTNKSLQKREYRVWDLTSPSVDRTIDGWQMLLRYFCEGSRASLSMARCPDESGRPIEPFSVRRYTDRRSSELVRRWR